MHYGCDELLCEARVAVLEDAGYEVLSAETPAAVLRTLRARRVSLVIACHSIPADELESVVRQMRQYKPRVPILVVHVGGLINPQRAMESPACDMIKSIPATWDETIVLPPSEIGELAIYARRSGDTWFLACINGPGERSVDIPLSFLSDGEYQTLMVKDGKDETPATQPTTQPIGTTAIVVDKATMKGSDHIKMDLVHGGGFLARFSK